MSDSLTAMRYRQAQTPISRFSTAVNPDHQSSCDSPMPSRDLGSVPPVALAWHTFYGGSSDISPIRPLQTHYFTSRTLKRCQAGGTGCVDEAGGQAHAR